MKVISKLLINLIGVIILCAGCTNILEDIFSNDEELGTEELIEKYFTIATEDLNGWEQGYTDGNNYIVGSHISDSDSTVFMLSSENKPNSHIYILFDANKSLIGFGTEDDWISSQEGEGTIYLNWFDDNDNICGDYYETDIESKSLPMTKAVSTEALFDYEKLSKITGVIGYAENAKNINNHIIEKEWWWLAKDVTSLSASIIIDILKASPTLQIGLFLGEMWIDGVISTHYQRFQMAMYNECCTEITEISINETGEINVFVTIRNANSVPPELVRNYYPTNEDIANNVYCGIVGREGVYPTSILYTEPYKKEDVLDRNWGKEYYLMYTFPKPNSNERYVFRSYLKSTRILNDKGQVSNGYIKYSSPYYFYDIGFIDEFSQESVSENEDEYIFKCTAHASINSLENVSSWGIYYDNGDLFPQKFSPKEYLEPSITSQSSADFEMEIRIKKSYFGNDAYKQIKLGIYSYSVNDNNTKLGTSQVFELNIMRKRLKRYNSHYVLYYDEKGRVIKHIDTRYNYSVEIKYNDENNSASIYEDGEYSGSAQISNGLVRSICGDNLTYDSNNNLIKSGSSSHTWSNGNITRSSRNYPGHTEYSDFTYGTQINKLNFDVWASYNCYFPTYYIYFPNKNVNANLPISCNYTYGKATYTYEFDEDGYITKATEHFTTYDGSSGTETFTFEYETY